MCIRDSAYAHRFQERAAYQWNAELSVYVDENCTGMGMGKALYQALIEILKCQNVKNAYEMCIRDSQDGA